MKNYHVIHLIHLLVLIGLFFSISFAQTYPYYTAIKITIGRHYIYDIDNPAQLKCPQFICRALVKDTVITDKPLPYHGIKQALVDIFDSCFATPITPDVEKTLIDKPGDTVMIIYGENRYKAIVNKMGIDYNNVIVCSLKDVDSLPQINDISNPYFIVLRKGSYYNGPIHRYKRYKSFIPSLNNTIDSLKISFIQLNIREKSSHYFTGMSIWADQARSTPDTVLLEIHRTYELGANYSALYRLTRNINRWNVQVLVKPTDGDCDWNFHSSLDINGDGMTEYLGDSSGNIGFYSFVDGDFLCLYTEIFNINKY
jgi:hypothetical protein